MTIYPGGFWYEDHCLLIKTYSAPKIRWRYGAEPWREIVGDDYSFEEIQNLTQNTTYQAVYRKPTISNGCLQSWQTTEFTSQIPGTLNGIQSYILTINGADYSGYVHSSFPGCGSNEQPPPPAERNKNYRVKVFSGGVSVLGSIITGFGYWLLRIQPVNPSLRTTQCVFKVFLDGAVVYTETRDDCPEVEKLSCEVNPVEQLDIETSPLGSIIVSKVAFDQNGQSALDLPDGCIAVYNQIPYTPIGGAGGSPVIYSFVGQFCSAVGCSEPEVLHLDGKCIPVNPCIECPDGTCSVECDDHICCYNTDGVSILEIPLADYCGENT